MFIGWIWSYFKNNGGREEIHRVCLLWISRWNFSVKYFVGLSGRLISTWSPNFKASNMSLCNARIILEVESFLNARKFKVLNCYRPCTDRKEFGEKVKEYGLLIKSNLIMGGDT